MWGKAPLPSPIEKKSRLLMRLSNNRLEVLVGLPIVGSAFVEASAGHVECGLLIRWHKTNTERIASRYCGQVVLSQERLQPSRSDALF